MSRTITRMMGVGLMALLTCGAIIAPVQAAGEDASVQQMQEQLKAVRLELAQTQLQLKKALADLDELKQYVAAGNPQQQIEQWRRERQTWQAQREQLVAERKKIEQARASLRQQSSAVQQQLAATPPPVKVDPNRPAWNVDYKIAAVPTGTTSESVYINPVSGDVLLSRYPDIDRKHIMVRGTWQNKSAAPWRYTFEIRIADKIGRIIGSWRYQTPLLSPNELHQFEVKVPVTDVGQIEHYQIGNIEPDQPQAQPAKAGG